MSANLPRIWVLLGPRKGDNNQVLALAEALGLPFETRTLSYNLLRALGGRFLGKSLASLTAESRARIRPPWPDLIIAIGRRSVPVARWVRRENERRTKLVRVGHPRIDPEHFDLVITTRQYPVPKDDNVLLLPLAMSRYSAPPEPNEAERACLDDLPRPHLLMAVGGATKYWQLSPPAIAEAGKRLAARARAAGGTLLVVGSPRTNPQVLQALEASTLHDQHVRLVADNSLRFPVLLADADEHFVTGDSISMISEAILTGKPVGLVPIELSSKGRRRLENADKQTPRRDLRRFWDYLQSEGLVGTLAAPARSTVENPARTAAAAVRRLLGDGVE